MSWLCSRASEVSAVVVLKGERLFFVRSAFVRITNLFAICSEALVGFGEKEGVGDRRIFFAVPVGVGVAVTEGLGAILNGVCMNHTMISTIMINNVVAAMFFRV